MGRRRGVYLLINNVESKSFDIINAFILPDLDRLNTFYPIVPCFVLFFLLVKLNKASN